MTPMKFVVKYFSEIAIKSKPVRHVSGITYILEVREHPLPALDGIVEHVLPVYTAQLQGRSFAVRCKHTGTHNFTSVDVEREVGAAIAGLGVSRSAAWTRYCP